MLLFLFFLHVESKKCVKTDGRQQERPSEKKKQNKDFFRDESGVSRHDTRSSAASRHSWIGPKPKICFRSRPDQNVFRLFPESLFSLSSVNKGEWINLMTESILKKSIKTPKRLRGVRSSASGWVSTCGNNQSKSFTLAARNLHFLALLSSGLTEKFTCDGNCAFRSKAKRREVEVRSP